MLMFRNFSVISILFITAGSVPADTPPASLAKMRGAALAFIATLDDAGRGKVLHPFDADTREDFRYTPRDRGGMPLKEMTPAQVEASKSLLSSVLSDKGALKVRQILILEGVLAELEKRPDYRDAGKYHFMIFGDPAKAGPWGWKYEGHHVSLNYTVGKDGGFSVTPSFLGANPAEVREGEHKGLRVLAEEEDLARALVVALLESGSNKVVFSRDAPAEILTGEDRKARALEPVGIGAAEMTAAQKNALIGLVAAYANRHHKDLADAEMRKIREAGVEKIRFGWAGGIKPGEAWYYRIQGPGFLIEAANTQNQANHIHTTWRSTDGDFGRDILAEHYRQHQKDHGNH